VELVAQDEALELPPGFAASLGEIPGISVERRRQLLRAAVTRRPGDLNLLMLLGDTYQQTNRREGLDDRVRWFQAAIATAPANAAAHNNLGSALKDKGQVDEAIDWFKKAIKLDPKLANARVSLGAALADKGQQNEAIACYRKAIELDSNSAEAHTGLGVVLLSKGQVDDAIAYYKKAIAIDPKYALAHSNLGSALRAKGQEDEAIASYQKAIELDPQFAAPHTGLGNALSRKGKVDEAIACYRKAIELDPTFALAHYNLANLLNDQGQVDEAIACDQKAIELDPKFAAPHTGLGNALLRKGKVDEAIACYRKAIELDPTFALAHYLLGNVLNDKGQVDEAIACFQKTIELDPKHAEAQCNLGGALAKQGRFVESLAALKRGHELGTKKSGWRYPSAAWVREAEAKAAMEAKLPAFQKDEFQPGDNQERLALAGVCEVKKLHKAAAGLYAAAFAADPKLADDLGGARRYNAACNAALAAAGKGEDAAKLDDAAKATLARQALDWLKADLTVLTKLLESGPPQARPFIVQTLSRWKQDSDLAVVRNTAALAKLSADEHKAFAQLWTDVEALLKKANAKLGAFLHEKLSIFGFS
jgi:tetratricopeptide (TPR) repeat protein